MNFKPLTTLMTGVGSLLLLAGSAHAQGWWGAPCATPYQPQPRYASPCGPQGCSTRNSGYSNQLGCANGLCNQPRDGYSTNYAPRGNGCANGTCSPQPRYYSNTPRGNAPGDYGYSGYSAPNRGPQEYVAPQGYGSYRPSYQSDRPDYQYEPTPNRAAPQPARMPGYDDEFSANNQRGFETTSVDWSRTGFDNQRSPFYP